MRKLILGSLLIALLFGCKDRNKIEMIPDHEAEYYSLNMVETTPKPVNDNSPQPLTFEAAVKKFHAENNPNKKIYYPVSARIFINENGEIDKIKTIGGKIGNSVMETIKEDGEVNYKNNEDIVRIALPQFEKIKFKPATLGGMNVKSRADIGAIYVATPDGEVGFRDGINFVDLNFEFGINEIDEDIFSVKVDKMPSPIGGMKAIQQGIRYPEIAKRAGIQGRVFVKAFIDTTGTIVKTEIMRGIGGGCDQAAIDAIKKVKFTPGMENGKPVNVQVTVPILFRLQ